MLTGNLIAILSSTLIHYVYSKFVDPQNYNFSDLDKEITLVEYDPRGLSSAERDECMLAREEKWAKRWAYGLTLILVVIWPLASIPAGVFSQTYFSFWVLGSIIWGAAAAFCVAFLPLIESWRGISSMMCSACYWSCGYSTKTDGSSEEEGKIRSSARSTESHDTV
jgi:urea-proton symporter